ncbi:hypothetical protein BD310DRAFT_917388 [Dichomitus squalens]|uniref:Uncharacterized protein n=1 Tax=Dichomitus squalens TaxID=114155 RepID=A0A4Q9Q6F0_9APHY|nr:hypothetical protein BD310DRAFT_917388 [Dichomitus squalens]
MITVTAGIRPARVQSEGEGLVRGYQAHSRRGWRDNTSIVPCRIGGKGADVSLAPSLGCG